jgi:hypothetical protein
LQLADHVFLLITKASNKAHLNHQSGSALAMILASGAGWKTQCRWIPHRVLAMLPGVGEK